MTERRRHRRHLPLSAPNAHWTAHRKAEVIHRIRIGELTMVAACERYDISAEELAIWMRRYREHGDQGLKVTKLQEVGR